MNTDDIPSTAQPPPLEPPLPQKLDLKSLFEALLRRPQALVARLAEPDHGATGKFAFMALLSILLFGFVLGCFAKHEQLWAAPLKITAGLIFSGRHPKQPIMQILELPREATAAAPQISHPYFIAGQFHPELTSRPLHPQPLFMGLIAAAIRRKYPDANDPALTRWLRPAAKQPVA